MSMFSVFSFGAAPPFDLPTALKDWATTAPDHPVPEFRGKPKRKDDLTADAWLTRVEKGSTARNVPKAHWPAVAKHFMVKKARTRVLEVEKVMRAVHGGQWDWCWKDFRVAVLNMGWNIEETKTREVHVERKSSGLWWIVGGKDEPAAPPTPPPKSSNKAPQTPKKASADAKSSGGPSTPKPSTESKLSMFVSKASPAKAPTTPKAPKDAKPKDPKPKDPKPKDAPSPKPKEPKPPAPARSGSLFALPALPFLRPTPQPQQTMLQTISAQVPLWLLAATDALAVLTNEHPDALTAVATALVAVGTVTGGGSAAVAAIGEAAVVVGRALKTAHDRSHSSAAR